MALLDRVKERIETDLSDGELSNLITEAQAEITRVCGPVADPAQPITVMRRGLRAFIWLARPLDQAHPVTITETTPEWPIGTMPPYPAISLPDPVVLDDNDWRAWGTGRSLQRLATGTHPHTLWAPSIEVSYVPLDDTPQRDEITIKLVQLSLEYEGVLERRVGDTQTVHGIRSTGSGGGSPLVYADERDRLINSLLPTPAVSLR